MPDIDYGQILEALNDKVDLSGSWSAPTSQYDDLTLGASTSTYTAPADGYVVFHCVQNQLNGYAFLRNTTAGEIASYGQPTTTNNFEIRTYIPVRKSDVFLIDYSGITGTIFRFVYAQKNN